MLVDKFCDECGTDKIRLVSWLQWDVHTQRWNLALDGGEYDEVWCMECEDTTKIYEGEWPNAKNI